MISDGSTTGGTLDDLERLLVDIPKGRPGLLPLLVAGPPIEDQVRRGPEDHHALQHREETRDHAGG